MIFGFFEPDVPTVSAEDVYKSLQDKEHVTILDVRTPSEFAKNKIKGSINVPVNHIEKIRNVLSDKSKKVFVYCLSGSRSVVAVDAMVKLGYTNVFNMKSGLLAWRAKKFPLV